MKNNNPFAAGNVVAVSNVIDGVTTYRKAVILGVKEKGSDSTAESYHSGKIGSYDVRFCDNKRTASVSSMAIHDISLLGQN